MNSKSDVFTVRFSDDEINEIKNYMKKYNFKSKNMFFRTAVGFLIGFTEGMIAIASSPEVNSALNQITKELKTELDKVPPTKAKLRGKMEIFEKAIFPKYEKELKKGAKHVEPFTKKRTAGRPKKPKRKRGDRKNLDYGK